MNSNRKSILLGIGLLFLIFSLPIAIFLMRREQRYTGRASFPNSVPQFVRVTNVHPKGFTVSWMTNESTTGKVRFCGTNSACSSGTKDIEDVRGGDTNSKTHYVNVTNDSVNGVVVNPLTENYFLVLSGDSGVAGRTPTANLEKEIYNQNEVVLSSGLSFKTTTAPLVGDENSAYNNPPGAYSMEKPLASTNPYYQYKYASFVPCPDGTDTLPTKSCFRPNPIWGEVKKTDNSNVAGAIIYFTLKDSANIVKSRMISAITETNSPYTGKWVLDLANFYETNLPFTGSNKYAGYLPFTESNPYTLTGEVVAEGHPLLTQGGMKIPETVNTACYANANSILNCTVAPQRPTEITPLVFVVEDTPLPTATPTTGVIPTATPTPGNTTITPTVTPTPGSGNRRDVNEDNYINATDIANVLGESNFPCYITSPSLTITTKCNMINDSQRDINQDTYVHATDIANVLGESNFPCYITSPSLTITTRCN